MPPKKPTALKILEGNPGKRPLPQNEPKPKPKAPKCPSHLSREAKREWKDIAPKLEKLGLLTNIDKAALAAYCDAYGRWVEAEKGIKKTGLVIETKSGNIIQSPYVGAANRAMMAMHKYLVEFGMTPSSRSRIQVKPDDDDSEFAALLT